MAKHVEIDDTNNNYTGTTILGGVTLLSAGISAYNFAIGSVGEGIASAVVAAGTFYGAVDDWAKTKKAEYIDDIVETERRFDMRERRIENKIHEAEDYMQELTVKKDEVFGAIDELQELKNTLHLAEDKIEKLSSYRANAEAYLEGYSINGRKHEEELGH